MDFLQVNRVSSSYFYVWATALDNREFLDVAYIDFAKAFDSVVHSKLLAKLRCIGIHRWFSPLLDQSFFE